ncbi:hypothetical protein [Roseimaritima sediminicola]|uniref:hypothetical protein n=1 Tax=Roseimaritima sediminicola TaxID=2662066 RepID=UPI00129837A9|nr:hypothetical protein [Roseimaritima sediminicola]
MWPLYICFIFTEPQPAQHGLTPKVISAGVEQQQQSYLDTAFSYQATMQPEGDGAEISTNIFSVLRSNGAGERAPWRKWEKYLSVEELDGEELLVEYYAFNGQQFAKFSRNYGEGAQHAATSWPTEQVVHYQKNVFDEVLVTDLLGVPRYLDHHRTFYKKNFSSYDIRIVEVAENRVSGRDVVLLAYSNPDLGVEYQVGVALPECIIVEYVAQKQSDPAVRYVAFEVTEIGSDSKGAYPLGGTYHETNVSGDESLDYTFSVTEVRRLNASEHRETWVPDWPPGSSGYDMARGVRIQIPSDVREMERAQILRLAQSTGAARFGGTARAWIVLVNVVAVLGVVCFLFIKRQKSR